VSANAPFWDAGITGRGQVVGSGDTGADRRNCYLSAATKFTMYRGIVMENGTLNEADDDDGHGTHVCGSIAGFSGTSGSADRNGEHNGVAKDARLAFTDLAGADGDLVNTDNMGSDYYQHAYDAGARIHSDSWGYSGYSSKSYSSTTYQVDEFAAANPLFLPMFAVGNTGDDTTTGVDTYGAPTGERQEHPGHWRHAVLQLGAAYLPDGRYQDVECGDRRTGCQALGARQHSRHKLSCGRV